MERTPGASRSLCVCAKNRQILFTANGMQTVRGWRSTDLQSHPHIRTFSLRTIPRARVYEATGFMRLFPNCIRFHSDLLDSACNVQSPYCKPSQTEWKQIHIVNKHTQSLCRLHAKPRTKPSGLIWRPISGIKNMRSPNFSNYLQLSL